MDPNGSGIFSLGPDPQQKPTEKNTNEKNASILSKIRCFTVFLVKNLRILA
jgi:hypothetical protein